MNQISTPAVIGGPVTINMQGNGSTVSLVAGGQINSNGNLTINTTTLSLGDNSTITANGALSITGSNKLFITGTTNSQIIDHAGPANPMNITSNNGDVLIRSISLTNVSQVLGVNNAGGTINITATNGGISLINVGINVSSNATTPSPLTGNAGGDINIISQGTVSNGSLVGLTACNVLANGDAFSLGGQIIISGANISLDSSTLMTADGGASDQGQVNGGGSIQITAKRDATIASGIMLSAQQTGNVSITAGRNLQFGGSINVSCDVPTLTVFVKMTATSGMLTDTGTIIATCQGNSSTTTPIQGATLVLAGGSVTLNGASITDNCTAMNGQAGTINITATNDAGDVQLMNSLLQSSGPQGGDINLNSNRSISIDSASAIRANGQTAVGGQINLIGAKTSFGTITVGGNLNVDSTNNSTVSQRSAITLLSKQGGGQGNDAINVQSSAILSAQVGNNGSSEISLQANNNAEFELDGTLTLNSAPATASFSPITIAATKGNLVVNGSTVVTAPGITLAAASGFVRSTGISFNGPVAVYAGAKDATGIGAAIVTPQQLVIENQFAIANTGGPGVFAAKGDIWLQSTGAGIEVQSGANITASNGRIVLFAGTDTTGPAGASLPTGQITYRDSANTQTFSYGSVQFPATGYTIDVQGTGGLVLMRASSGNITFDGTNQLSSDQGKSTPIPRQPSNLSPVAATFFGPEQESVRMSPASSGFIIDSEGVQKVSAMRGREALVIGQRHGSMRLGPLNLSLSKGSIVYVLRRDDYIALVNMNGGECIISTGGRRLQVAEGQLALGTGTGANLHNILQNVGWSYRSGSIATAGPLLLYLADVSFPSMIRTSRVMANVMKTGGNFQGIQNQILKAAAALMLVTAPHGAYRR